jgi:IclR family acetate operon transcriptional repressor
MHAVTPSTDPHASHGSRPRDFMTSVDTALRLIVLLRDNGLVTVTSAAQDLQIAPSRAHRTLQMLVYRGFATRNESHGYLPGPALFATSLPEGRGAVLVEATAPYLEAIARETSETCHVVTFSGAETHFLFSVEGTHNVRCSERRGQVIPSTRNAGGLAYLATLSGSELRSLYPSMEEGAMEDLRKELHVFRRQGFAVNRGLFEREIHAVSSLVVNNLGDPLGAVCVAIPTSRFPSVVTRCVTALKRHSGDLNRAVQSVRGIDR